MLKETFALFQPALWQQEGLITIPHEERKPATRTVRKMEKWIVATSAAVALSAAFAGSLPTYTSFLTGNAGIARRVVIGFEEGETAAAKIQGADIPANYWSGMAQEVV